MRFTIRTIFSFFIFCASLSVSANLGDFGNLGNRCRPQQTCGDCFDKKVTCTVVECDGTLRQTSKTCSVDTYPEQDETAYRTIYASAYCSPKIQCGPCDGVGRTCEITSCENEVRYYKESCRINSSL